jgi:hypothetical protein
MISKISALWRNNSSAVTGQRANPLRLMAGACGLGIAWAVYDFVRYRHTAWNQTVALMLSGAFLLAYALHRRIAWLIGLLIIGALLPLNFTIFYLEPGTRPHSVTGTAFTLVFWVACIVYIFWARTRYFAHIREHQKDL